MPFADRCVEQGVRVVGRKFKCALNAHRCFIDDRRGVIGRVHAGQESQLVGQYGIRRTILRIVLQGQPGQRNASGLPLQRVARRSRNERRHDEQLMRGQGFWVATLKFRFRRVKQLWSNLLRDHVGYLFAIVARVDIISSTPHENTRAIVDHFYQDAGLVANGPHGSPNREVGIGHYMSARNLFVGNDIERIIARQGDAQFAKDVAALLCFARALAGKAGRFDHDADARRV